MSSSKKVYIDNFTKDYMGFKVLAIGTVIISIMSVAAMYYKFQQGIEKSNNAIWVVDPDHRPYKAQRQVMYNYDGREFELEQLVREFYARAYEYEIDDFHQSIEGALALLGDSKDDFVLWVNDESIETNMVQNNWSYKVRVDSVLWDFDSQPVRLLAFGRQIIKARRTEIERNLYTSFTVSNLRNRSMENSFGAQLDEWEIFNTNVLEERRIK